jgi:hypothetical protein
MDLITIKVPPGATRGEHYGVIWVQQESYARGTNGLGVNEVDRVGIRRRRPSPSPPSPGTGPPKASRPFSFT